MTNTNTEFKEVVFWEEFKSNQFGEATYWDEFYRRNKEPFEWLQSYDDIHDIINEFCLPDKSDKVLNLGCGNSELAYKLITEGGFTGSVRNLDYSEECIQAMQAKYADLKQLSYELCDVTDTTITEKGQEGREPLGKYDLILDKGCLDSILCGEYSTKKAKKYLTNVYKTLNRSTHKDAHGKDEAFYSRHKIRLIEDFKDGNIPDYITRSDRAQSFFYGTYILISLGDDREKVLQRFLSEETDAHGNPVQWDIIRLKINKKEVDMFNRRHDDTKFDNTEEYQLNFIEYEKKIKDKRN